MPDLVTVAGTGFQVDRSIAGELAAILKSFPVKLSAAYAPPGVGGHAPDGDHPKGLGVDIVPDTARGGTWADVTRLAQKAEPTQNHPISAFRWVGYTGDPNHGPGNHLHLSFLPPSSASSGGGGGGILGTLGKIVTAPIDALGAAGDYAQQQGAAAGKRGDAGVKSALGDIGGVGGAVASQLAKPVADELVNLAADSLGKNLLRWTLYAALIVAGVALVLAGGARVMGVGAPSPSTT